MEKINVRGRINTFIEYVWIDGNNSVRSKNRMLKLDYDHDTPEQLVSKIPEWNYDGSSTKQATTKDSEVIIKPVRVYAGMPIAQIFYLEIDEKSILQKYNEKKSAKYVKKTDKPVESMMWMNF